MTFTLKYDTHGLIPAICQDAINGEVLMVAWMCAAKRKWTAWLTTLLVCLGLASLASLG